MPVCVSLVPSNHGVSTGCLNVQKHLVITKEQNNKSRFDDSMRWPLSPGWQGTTEIAVLARWFSSWNSMDIASPGVPGLTSVTRTVKSHYFNPDIQTSSTNVGFSVCGARYTSKTKLISENNILDPGQYDLWHQFLWSQTSGFLQGVGHPWEVTFFSLISTGCVPSF